MSLEKQRCTACTPETPRISEEEARKLLTQVPGFDLAGDGTRISRTFRFANYYETMAFVNAVAFIAHREDHHPDLEVHYRTCTVTYSTHAISGLSMNDFICAAKVNALLEA
ncbi:MAG: 4a-hydroxytetrahydrobiopterin dehydratase [Pseudomonadota bacterium]|nr:MAG: 4a-hydroxytetrahydrobiopterin dehydratase [Pseudomonadota bacterium]